MLATIVGGRSADPLFVCDAASGECKAVATSEGALCVDGDDCTEGDVCTAGTCAGTPVPVCGLAPTVCEPDHDNDGVATAVVLERGAAQIVMRAKADPLGEDDWYAVELLEDEILLAETRADCGSRADTLLALYDSDGHSVLDFNDDDEGGPWSRVQLAGAPSGGTYYLRVSTYAGAGASTYLLTLDITTDPGCTSNADCECAEHVCTGDTTTPGECVEAMPSESEPNDLVSEASPAAVDAEVAGDISSFGDVDSFVVSLAAGVPVAVETRDFCGAATDTEVELLGPGGASVLASNDDAGEDSVLSLIRSFTAEAEGAYVVRVRGKDGATGRYRLLVSDLRCGADADCGCADQRCGAEGDEAGLCLPRSTEAEPNDEADRASPTALGTRKHGAISEPFEVDYFYVDLEPGSYDVETHGYCGTTLDTHLTLLAADGVTPLKKDDDGGAKKLSLISGANVAVAGRYLVLVEAYGADTGEYVVEVREVAP